ncbi:hypothetical protein GCM10027517_20490 [Phycicoccus ginsengisoli]
MSRAGQDPHRTLNLPWRALAGGLPAVVLVGSGIGLTLTGGHPLTEIASDSGPVVTVPKAPVEQPAAPTLPILPAPPEQQATPFGGGSSTAPAGSLPPSLTVKGIPAAALSAYQRAARIVDAADAQCRIDWALVGAIGKVESDHGRYGGNGTDSTGTVRPGIYGIPLNGANGTAVIHDTDGGTLDRDTTWDRAVGPMQFIPGTWRVVGVDANQDGRKDPQNLDDAATATAVYLCSGPGDLSTPAGARNAVLRYNHSDAYANEVLAIADAYRNGYTVVPDSGLAPGQADAAPYLPSGDPQTMAQYDPAAVREPAPARTSGGKPAKGSSGRTGSSGGTGGTGGTGAGGGAVPTPTTTSSSGPVGQVVGGVTGVVGRVVGGVTGSTPSPTTTASSSPSPSSTPALPLQVNPTNGKCPTGYDPVLGALGVTVLCTLHR